MDEENQQANPVEDVRKIRAALENRFGGDVRRLGEYLQTIERALGDKSGAVIVKPPSGTEAQVG